MVESNLHPLSLNMGVKKGLSLGFTNKIPQVL